MNKLRLGFRLALNLAMVAVVPGIIQAATPLMPTFFARSDYPLPFDSEPLVVGDTNGDGIPDLINLQYGNGIVVVQLGNGDGTFRPGPTTNTVAGDSLTFIGADLNGDGIIDLVLNNGTGVVICTGNGDGTFQPGAIYAIPGMNDTQLGYSVIADFNGDGIPDIATTSSSSGVWLLTGKGGPYAIFNPAVLAVPLAGASGITTADFNGDGAPDLAVALVRPGGQDGNGFDVIFGNPNGTFQTPQFFSFPVAGAIVAGSLSKDGPPGLAVGNSNCGCIAPFFGDGAGGFVEGNHVDLPWGFRDNTLAIGDVNGDGIPDLVSSSGYVAYGEDHGVFTPPVQYFVSGGWYVVLDDLRHIGLNDIVVTSQSTAVSVLLNEGDNKGHGQFEDGVWTNVSGGASCGAKGDLNGDGRPDLVVTNSNGFTSQGISILIGTSEDATPFSAGATIALPGAGCAVVGDLNGDGKLDLLVPVNGTSGNTVVAYLGNGDGTFTQQSVTEAPSGGELVIGDFNHDGKLDFASSGNFLAYGNGDGTFQTPIDIVANPPEYGFSGIAAGDINRDGWMDLVLTNSYALSGANVFILLNNHKGGFGHVPASFGGDSAQPLLVDVNGDGDLDLILDYDNTANIYLGNGKGEFTFQVTFPSVFNSSFSITYMVADVNGDGIPDMCISSASTLDIYLGEGDATYASPFSLGTGPAAAGLLAERVHGQSATAPQDIVIPDTSGGVMVLLNFTQ